MATVTAISTKGGGGGKATLEYICRDDKTDNKKYVTALNCSLPTVYQEFKIPVRCMERLEVSSTITSYNHTQADMKFSLSLLIGSLWSLQR